MVTSSIALDAEAISAMAGEEGGRLSRGLPKRLGAQAGQVLGLVWAGVDFQVPTIQSSSSPSRLLAVCLPALGF